MRNGRCRRFTRRTKACRSSASRNDGSRSSASSAPSAYAHATTEAKMTTVTHSRWGRVSSYGVSPKPIVVAV